MLSILVHFAIAAAQNASASVAVSTSDAIGQPWIGFGLSWFPEPITQGGDELTPIPWTEDAFSLDTTRMDFIKPAITRITWHPEYFCPTTTVGVYNWTSTAVLNEFKALDYMKSMNYSVMTGWWTTPWEATSSNYSTVVADFLDYLVNEKGYTNIAYWNGINEPNHRDPSTDANWETCTTNVRTALDSKGITSLQVIGPDTQDAAADSWITAAAKDLNTVVGAYTKHLYPTGENDINDGSQEAYIQGIISSIDASDPSKKPFMVTEMGNKYGYNSANDSQEAVFTYEYGVQMADLAVQVIRAGTAAPMAWWLDDLGIKTWGMWDSYYSPALRPWFYTWSLLSRYVSPSSTLYAPTQPSGMRVLAAKSGQSDWTFVFVNSNSTAFSTKLTVANGGSITANKYVYSANSMQTDSNGFPTSTGQVSGNLMTGLMVQVPGDGMLLLTTM